MSSESEDFIISKVHSSSTTDLDEILAMALKYFNLRGVNKLQRNKKCISFSTAFSQNGQQRSSLFHLLYLPISTRKECALILKREKELRVDLLTFRHNRYSSSAKEFLNFL